MRYRRGRALAVPGFTSVEARQRGRLRYLRRMCLRELRKVKRKATFQLDFTIGIFYSTTIAATAFRALGVGYAANRENRYAEERTRAGSFVHANR